MKFPEKPPHLKNLKKYDRGAPHFHPRIKDFEKEILMKDITPNDNCFTLTENLKAIVDKYPNKRAIGKRIINSYEEKEIFSDGVKKTIKLPVFDEQIEWLTYSSMWTKVKSIGDGIVRNCGLSPNDKVCIYEKTRAEWLIIAHALWRHSIIVTTAYSNLGTKNLIYSLNKTKSTCIICSNVQVIIDNKDELPHLKYLIYLDELKKDVKCDAFKMISLNDIEKNGLEKPYKEEEVNHPKKDNHCVIMFTSGSTGVPKGVQIRHSNIIPACFCAKVQLGVNSDDVCITYLPLAHILELVVENALLFNGCSLGYGTPWTLTDRGAKPYGDIVAYKPTLMLGVPRVWDTVKKVIWEEMIKRGGLAKCLFVRGFKAKKLSLYTNGTNPIYNLLLFNTFKSKFGGRLRILGSGGAPLSQSSQEFMSALFDCPFIEGYGLTEVTGPICAQENNMYEFTTKNIGFPIIATQIKLVDVPEMGYLTSNNPEQGEIVISGPTITDGYFEDDEKTKECFKRDDHGTMWFYSGDIGKWNEDGTLTIIDRKKNLVKLSGGEYVAVANLEAIYGSSCPFIAPNGIFVYADPTQNFIVAVIQIQKSYALKWAEKYGEKYQISKDFQKDISYICSNKKAKELCVESLKEVAIKNSLKKFEMIKTVYLCQDEWSTENGLLTASNKLRRKPLSDKYKDILDGLYKIKSESSNIEEIEIKEKK